MRTPIYFTDGEIVAESGAVRVYEFDGILYLERGPGHSLWADSEEIKELKESTQKIVVMYDIYHRMSERMSKDELDLKANKYKANYMKDKLLLNILQNKKMAEDLIKRLKIQIK
jgi:hypothetical protein